jgi:hypothetical protein
MRAGEKRVALRGSFVTCGLRRTNAYRGSQSERQRLEWAAHRYHWVSRTLDGQSECRDQPPTNGPLPSARFALEWARVAVRLKRAHAAGITRGMSRGFQFRNDDMADVMLKRPAVASPPTLITLSVVEHSPAAEPSTRTETRYFLPLHSARASHG